MPSSKTCLPTDKRELIPTSGSTWPSRMVNLLQSGMVTPSPTVSVSPKTLRTVGASRSMKIDSPRIQLRLLLKSKMRRVTSQLLLLRPSPQLMLSMKLGTAKWLKSPSSQAQKRSHNPNHQPLASPIGSMWAPSRTSHLKLLLLLQTTLRMLVPLTLIRKLRGTGSCLYPRPSLPATPTLKMMILSTVTNQLLTPTMIHG